MSFSPSVGEKSFLGQFQYDLSCLCTSATSARLRRSCELSVITFIYLSDQPSLFFCLHQITHPKQEQQRMAWYDSYFESATVIQEPCLTEAMWFVIWSKEHHEMGDPFFFWGGGGAFRFSSMCVTLGGVLWNPLCMALIILSSSLLQGSCWCN